MNQTASNAINSATNKAPHSKPYLPWLIFIGCCLFSFVGYGLIVNTSGLYFTSLQKEFGASLSAITLPVTLRDLIGALALSAAGVMMRKINAKPMLSFSIAVCGIAFELCSQVSALWQFYVLFPIIGISMVVPVMVAPAVLLSSWFEKNLGLVMGIALGLSGIGGAVLNPIVAALIKALGWRWAYSISGIILMVLILPFTLFVVKWKPDAAKGEFAYGSHDALTKGSSAPQPVSAEINVAARSAFRTQTFVLFVLSMILLQIVSGFVQHVSKFELTRGLTLEKGALVVTGIMLGAAVGKASIGVLLDRFRAEIVVGAFVVVAILGWLGIAIVDVPTVAVVSGFLSGLGQGYLLVAIPWMIRKAFGPRNYGEILSIATMFSNVTLALAVTIHGAIVDAAGSYTPSFALVVVVYIVAMATGLAAYRKRPLQPSTH